MWHKDIILEEIGNITSITRISSKVNLQSLTAESVAKPSLLFVASAYREDGSRYLDPKTGRWITDVFTYELEKAYNDHLFGEEGDDGKFVLPHQYLSSPIPDS